MCSAYFVISCTVQRTEFTGLIKTCRKKITSFVFFYTSTHIQNDIADRDISSMQFQSTVVKGGAFVLKVPIKITETNT